MPGDWGRPRVSMKMDRDERHGQEIGNYIADEDAVGVDVTVLFQKTVEILELGKGLWYAKQWAICATNVDVSNSRDLRKVPRRTHRGWAELARAFLRAKGC